MFRNCHFAGAGAVSSLSLHRPGPEAPSAWLRQDGWVAAGPLHVLAVSSSGGVLLDLLALRPWFARHEVTWAVARAVDTEGALVGEHVHWVPERPGSAPWLVLPGLVEALRRLRADRPDVVISAGTGVAIPYFVAARVLGVPSVWVDTFNLVGRRGRAALICAGLASLVLVQRGSLVGTSSKTVAVGELY